MKVELDRRWDVRGWVTLHNCWRISFSCFSCSLGADRLGGSTLFKHNTHIVYSTLHRLMDKTHCYSTLHRLMDRTHRSDTTHTLLQHTSLADGQNTLMIRHNTHTVTAHFTCWKTEHTDQTQHPHCYSTLHRLGDRTH